MTPDDLIARLAHHRGMWERLLSAVSEGEARLPPKNGGWSLLVLVAHLADEERDDFRARIESTLADPGADWAPIDPEGWVRSRDYASKGWPDVVHDLLAERDRSMAWLESLDAPDWSAPHEHPAIGQMTAGDLLASWVAHDLRHLGQASRLLYGALAAGVAPYSVDYAG
jgi:uncharacterized damage-inducible protein DinB